MTKAIKREKLSSNTDSGRIEDLILTIEDKRKCIPNIKSVLYKKGHSGNKNEPTEIDSTMVEMKNK